jgi:NADH-quinone oxidoreductase subunit E
MSTDIKKIVAAHDNDLNNLIPILQEIQDNEGYISKETISGVAEALGSSESKIYGVATFYTQFKFIKPGKHKITVCQGTACHVRGSESLLDYLRLNLGIEPGESTEDGEFSLERVACLGCCALAPVMVVDGEVYGHLTVPKIEKILSRTKEE